MTMPPAHPPVIRTVTLTVEAMADGRFRLSSPQARGWAYAGRTERHLAEGIRSAYREVGNASMARAVGERYDLDELTMHVPGDTLAGRPQSRPRAAPRQHRGAYYPEEWKRLEDGKWRSPSGRKYREDSVQVQHVIAKLQSRGYTV